MERAGRAEAGGAFRYDDAGRVRWPVPDGEANWIVIDPEFDFDELNNRFDTMVMGRRTYEAVRAAGGGGSTPRMRVFVVTHTLRQQDHPDVCRSCSRRRARTCGCSAADRCFAAPPDGVVDTVEVAVIPVLLGDGVPLMAARSPQSGCS